MSCLAAAPIAGDRAGTVGSVDPRAVYSSPTRRAGGGTAGERPLSIRVYKDRRPQFGRAVYVDVDAVIIGDVVMERGANVWPGAVLRGDVERITIGAETSVQDNSVLHCDPEYPMVIGQRVIIGHGDDPARRDHRRRRARRYGQHLLNGCVSARTASWGAARSSHRARCSRRAA